jgi:hypothetical protein
LLSILSSHHRRIILPSFNQQESSFSPSRKPFFDSIDPKRKSLEAAGWHVLFVWECETRDAEGLRARLETFLSPRSSAGRR